jgi:hypothetical protein
VLGGKMRKSFIVAVVLIFAVVLIAIFPQQSNSIEPSVSIGLENTDHDIKKLEQMNMKFETPATQAKIKASIAIKKAEKFFGTKSKDIHVEYQLLTSPFRLFSDDAITKNPDLKSKGIEKLPAYIISFRGFDIQSQGPRRQSEMPSCDELNVVVDAKTGVVLLSFSYR